MDLGFHIPVFDIDGGPTAIAGELAAVGNAAEAAGATSHKELQQVFDAFDTDKSVSTSKACNASRNMLMF